MMTTVDALKALYVLLGGSADDVENISRIPDMIQAYEGLSSLTAVGDIQIGNYGETEINNSKGVKISAGENNDVNISGAAVNITSIDGDISLFCNDTCTINGGSNGLYLRSLQDNMELQTNNSDIILSTAERGEIQLNGGVSVMLQSEQEIYLYSGDSLNLQATNNDINLTTTGNGEIYIKQGNAESMTLENYIKSVVASS